MAPPFLGWSSVGVGEAVHCGMNGCDGVEGGEPFEGFGNASARLGMPLKLVTDGREGGRERYGASMILVRPDQFVAWSSDAGTLDAETVLRKAIGALQGDRA